MNSGIKRFNGTDPKIRGKTFFFSKMRKEFFFKLKKKFLIENVNAKIAQSGSNFTAKRQGK